MNWNIDFIILLIVLIVKVISVKDVTNRFGFSYIRVLKVWYFLGQPLTIHPYAGFEEEKILSIFPKNRILG